MTSSYKLYYVVLLTSIVKQISKITVSRQQIQQEMQTAMSLSTVNKQVKYGLITKKPQAQVPQKPKLQVFSREESDDEDSLLPANDIARVNAQLARRSCVIAPTIVGDDDPSIYDYDGAYESFKAPDKVSHQLSQADTKSREPPKSRYVKSLLSTAKLREKEKERVFEKNLLKERKEEDKEFGDKPKFMTAAYKKKLIEDEKWAYEDRLADEVEQRTDVRKSGMEGFYSNLMTKNVAMGGDVDAHAVSVYTAGSARQSHLMDEAKSVSASVQQAKAKVDSRGGGCSSSGSSVGTAGTSDKSSTKHDQSVVRTDICDDGRILDLSRAKREGASDEQPRKAQRTSSNVDKETVVGTETVVGAETVGNIMKPTVMVDKTEVILSAKDRYLARKRALEGNNSV